MDAAFEHLDFAVKRQPDFGPARTELGRWYQAKGNLDEARRQWVLGGQLNEPESLLLLGDSYPTGQVPADVPAAADDAPRRIRQQRPERRHLDSVLPAAVRPRCRRASRSFRATGRPPCRASTPR